MKLVVLKIIVAYKKHISPSKGFRCAYAAYYGGESCSTRIYDLVNSNGVMRAVPLARDQLRACSFAFKLLSEEPEKEEGKDEEKKKPKEGDTAGNAFCDMSCNSLPHLPAKQCGGGKAGGVDCGDMPCDCSF